MTLDNRGIRDRKRDAVEAALIADPTRSNRAIARATGTSHSTVAHARSSLIAAGRIAAPVHVPKAVDQPSGGHLVPGTPGNLSSASHGAHSGALTRPIRVQLEEQFRERFPNVDPPLIGLLAQRGAMLQRLTDWLEERGGPVRNRAGDVYGAANLHASLSVAFERQFAKLAEQEAAAARVPAAAALDAHLAALAAAREDAPDVEVEP